MIETVRITGDHIAKGARRLCSRCPGALAIGEIVAESVVVLVNRKNVVFYGDLDDRAIARVVTPPELRLFVGRFDGSDPEYPESWPYPTEFELDIPEVVPRRENR